jgi:hypothetical protein
MEETMHKNGRIHLPSCTVEPFEYDEGEEKQFFSSKLHFECYESEEKQSFQ